MHRNIVYGKLIITGCVHNIQLWAICKEIYIQLFKESNPSIDFNKIIETNETKKKDWFMKYYLSQKRQSEIINKFCKQHHLSTWEKQKVKEEINTGYSPNTCKETWEIF